MLIRYTYIDIAFRYGVHVKTVQKWVSEGSLGCLKIGKSVRFTEEQIFEFEKKMSIKAKL